MPNLSEAAPELGSPIARGSGKRPSGPLVELVFKALRSRESGVVGALVILCLVLTVATGKFMTPYNLGIVVRQIAFVGMVALGQTLVLLTGGIDLSVGYVAGLCSIIGSLLMVNTGINPYVCALIAMLLGAFLGFLNGALISYFRFNPFIATLAMGEVFAGMVLVITKGYPVTGIPASFSFLGQGMIASIPLPTILTVLVAVILSFMLKRTPHGRFIYAVGGNESAAHLAGISIKTVKISVYMLSGFMAAFAGLMFVSRANAGQPTIGPSWQLPSITAAILGGTSLVGGEGTMFGTIIGATLMGVLANGIVLMDISSYWERVIIGVVVIAAVLADTLRIKRS
ncbi:MAG: ABC transporter permease [Rectinemataceae bacterium]